MDKETIYSLENVEKYMTLFYSLNTNEIKISAYGIHDMSYFGKDQFDYNYGVLVVPKDDYIFDNSKLFRVVEGEVVLVQQAFLNKYKTI